jgi:hypothetical protein
VCVARLHYYPSVRRYLSWLIYQIVILFKILCHEDWDYIRITVRPTRSRSVAVALDTTVVLTTTSTHTHALV